MNATKAIGGYLELELARQGRPYHAGLLALNTGRNAFECLLRDHKPSRVWLPRYTCDALLQPLEKLGIPFHYYAIDEQLEPVDLAFDDEQALIVYINYFGLKDRTARRLAGQSCRLVIDNTQAFFSGTISGVPAFYSARKFFGVPDGAYLYSPDGTGHENLPRDCSAGRFAHLLARLDAGAEAGFSAYRANEELLGQLEPALMSHATAAVLASIDYAAVKQQRRNNYSLLHEWLGEYNQSGFSALDDEAVPMAYPFFHEGKPLREWLAARQIYCPQLWPSVLQNCHSPEAFEHRLARYTAPLPVDQRYGVKEMRLIADAVIEAIQHG